MGCENSRTHPTVRAIPFGSLLLPTIQLVFTNFYLGIALGSLKFAAKYTTATTSPWPFSNDKNSATEEFYILERYSNLFANLQRSKRYSKGEGRGDRMDRQRQGCHYRHSAAGHRSKAQQQLISTGVALLQIQIVTSPLFYSILDNKKSGNYMLGKNKLQ